jgi:hypothetical protein
MKLDVAINLAEACGLDTVGDAVLNIKLHAMSIFNYGEAGKEYAELVNHCKTLGFKGTDSLETAKAALCSCKICRTPLTEENLSKDEDGKTRYDCNGFRWCQKCSDEHDNIDWEEVHNKQKG